MFEVVDVTEGAVAKVMPRGELDSGASFLFEAKLDAVLASHAGLIVIACDELEMVSSAGLRVLLAFAKKVKKAGARMAMCGMRPMVYRVFEICEFTTFLTICPKMEDALAKIGAQRGDGPPPIHAGAGRS